MAKVLDDVLESNTITDSLDDPIVQEEVYTPPVEDELPEKYRGKTPKEIVIKINQDLNSILNKKDIKEKLQLQFYDVLTGTPDEFAALIEKDLIRFGKIIKEVNIKP
jgi:hypothetical protein